jgi:hypothetical protein
VSLPLRRRTTVTVRRSGRTLRAQLTSAGRPLADHPLSLTQRLRGATRWRAVCGKRIVILASSSHSAPCALQTDAAGRVEIRLPAGPSRTLRISFAGDALLLPARDSASVRTPASARLHASPRTIPAGGAVRFTGRLRGGHIPRGGKLVELQARVSAGWRTFATLRTDRRGRFRHTHRFSAVASDGTYWFRVRVRRETAYPFERATTDPLAVRLE